MDAEARIPAALETLGPVAERDVAVLAPDDGELTSQLLGLGSWVRALPDPSLAAIGAIPDERADVVVAGWSAFCPGSPEWDGHMAQARRVLRPGGRLLVVHDYGRDQVTELLGGPDRAARLQAWSRPSGPFLGIGFRIRVLHCWWRWDSLAEATDLLTQVFGSVGASVAAGMRRPRLTWKVAVYHRAMELAEPVGTAPGTGTTGKPSETASPTSAGVVAGIARLASA